MNWAIPCDPSSSWLSLCTDETMPSGSALHQCGGTTSTVATAIPIPWPLLFSRLCEPPRRLEVSCSPSATVLALHRPFRGHLKRSRGRIRFRTARQYSPSIRDVDMSHPMFLSRSMTVRDLIRACDPFSDEVAQAFLRSEVCDLFLPGFALIEG